MKRREEIICGCFSKMTYEGLETVQILNEDGSDPRIGDLKVFICHNCENKLENSEPLMAKYRG